MHHYDVGGSDTKVNGKVVDSTIKNADEAKLTEAASKSTYAAAEKKTIQDVKRAYADTQQWMREHGAGKQTNNSDAVIEAMGHRFDQTTADAAKAIQAKGTTSTGTVGTNSATSVTTTATAEMGGGLLGKVAGAFGFDLKASIAASHAKTGTQSNELATSTNSTNSNEASKTDSDTRTHDKTKTGGKTTAATKTDSATMSDNDRRELTKTIGQDISAQAGAREQWSRDEAITKSTTLSIGVQTAVTPTSHGEVIGAMLHNADVRGTPQGRDFAETEQNVGAMQTHIATMGGPQDVVNVTDPANLKPLAGAGDWMNAPAQDAEAAVNRGEQATNRERGAYTAQANATPAPMAPAHPETDPGAAFDAMRKQNATANSSGAAYVEDVRASILPNNPWRGDPAQNVAPIAPSLAARPTFKADR